jgi:hypothetical protein
VLGVLFLVVVAWILRYVIAIVVSFRVDQLRG